MDLYNLVVSAKLTKGGGGGDIDVDELSVTENGTYTAEEGHAYSPVTVDVPNSYAASDEGKVVSNGALVSQTSATKTANGTYDTTLNNEVVVNVPGPSGNINITSTAQTDVSAYATAQVVDADLVAGNIKKDVDILGVVGTYEGGGGGGSSYTLLHEEDVAVSTTSTSDTLVKKISISGCYTSAEILYVRIYDKLGLRDGYFYGTENFATNCRPQAYGSDSDYNKPVNACYFGYVRGGNVVAGFGNSMLGYGIYLKEVNADDSIDIHVKYNSNITKTIDSIYHIEVYRLAYPNNVSPFPSV